jgi:polyhydroxybutyrate depolymerase
VTAVAIAVTCALAVPAWSSPAASVPSSPRAASTCNRPHPPGQTSAQFTFQGTPRTFLLYVPTSYRGDARVPLVFNFHGFGSNATQQMALADFGPIANHNDFIVVAPNGQGSSPHWAFGNEPGLQNDIVMVGALLTRLEHSLCVDPTRVYATGMSDGGAMTSVLACTSADKFAAFAAVAVVVYCGSSKGRPVAIESYAGSKDPIVPTNGGRVNCCGNPVLPAKAASMAKWAAHDACKPKYTDVRIKPHVIRRTWSGCKPGSTSVYYLVEGDGHTWPGGPSLGSLGHATKEISASQLIWKFFSAHKLAS